MNQESGFSARCIRHPNQFFTGFCSLCLVERLSNIGATEPRLEAPCSLQREIVAVPDVVPDVWKKPSDVRVRRTLQYLFQLDDGYNVEDDEHAGKNQTMPSTSNACGCESRSDDAGYSKYAIKVNSCRVIKMMENGSNVAEEITVNAHVARKINGTEDVVVKNRVTSCWSSSVLPKREITWRRTRSVSKKDKMLDDNLSGRFDDKQLESTPNFRHSCDWRGRHVSNKSSWEPPRHSWDGSMVSRALTCSCACLEEQEDDFERTERNMHGETVIRNSDQSTHNIDRDQISDASVADEKHSSSNGTVETLSRSYEESQPGNPMSAIRGKQSRGWSKLWDWNVTYSLRDLVKKREHILQRSVSETWQGRKNNNAESLQCNGGLQPNINSHSSARTHHCPRQSVNDANGDWQTKSELKVGRSRSLHYSSPRNLDNGLLRFYLTPLRSSRRLTSKASTKVSHYFGRGIFRL